MSKYKKGDIVTIKHDLIVNSSCASQSYENRELYPYEDNGCIKYQILNNDMSKFKGKTVTISSVRSDGQYYIKEDGFDWTWVDSMFETSKTINTLNQGYNEKDKVKINEDLSESKKYYYITKSGNERELYTNEDMFEMAGDIVTINKLYNDGTFTINEDGGMNYWSFDMVSKIVDKTKKEDKEMASKFERDFDGNIVVKELCLRIGQEVMLNPELPYDNCTRIIFKNVKDGDVDNIVLMSNYKHFAGRKLILNKFFDDGDAEVLLDDDESMYLPQGALIPWVEQKTKSKEIITEIKEVKKINDEGGVKMSKMSNVLTKMFGEIGEVKDGSLALTFMGAVAIKRKDGDYVRYDSIGETLENQGELILPGSEKFMMLMPSPTVTTGDIIKHKGKFLQVLEVKANGNLSTVNFEGGTKTNVIRETNLFNMQYYTKVISMMTGLSGGDGTTPGGLNPMMMLLMNKEDGQEMDMTTLMMMSGMFGGAGATGQMNPMMMLMMLGDKKDGKSGDMMETMMMMSMMNGQGGANPFGAMFGQVTTPMQVAEPLKPISTSSDEMMAIQADAIIALQKTVKDLTDKLNVATTKKPRAKKEPVVGKDKGTVNADTKII